jgi:hypothetical protein
MNFDEAAEKASRYMLDYLESEHQLSRADAYMLCSLACDLKIAQVVNEPHRFVAMHVRKDILQRRRRPSWALLGVMRPSWRGASRHDLPGSGSWKSSYRSTGRRRNDYSG